MTVTKTATAHFASGEIKFSTLRDTFKGSGTEIKASELFRDTDTNQPNPYVPDATENASIAANNYGSSFNGTNLSLVTFRNSIKEYNFTQTDIDTKVDIDALAWNSNLPKNVKKKFIVNGTIGSDDSSVAAASVDAEIRNLTIDIGTAGKIHGAPGAGGVYGTNSGKGGDGGLSLYARSTATDSLTKWVIVDLKSTSQLFGGGGGGGAGPKGGSGGTGASVHNLAGGVGGPGGNGGNGGNGQGYNAGVGNGVAGTDPGNNGSSANSKKYEVSTYDKNAVPLVEGTAVISERTYYSGTGGKGGVGGYGGNGGTFGSAGSAGNNTGQTQGDKGGDTSSAKYYQFPTNENFNTYGMLVGYTKLNYKNFITKHNNICTAYATASTPVTDSNGTTIGYKYFEFWDGSGDDWNCKMTIEDATPNLAAGETAASNPRFNINGYGLFADSGGKIKINVQWDDSSGDSGISVDKIIITGRNSQSTFTYSNNNTLMIDYDPFTSAEWGSSPNIGVFGMYRDATHTGNYITFGGKLVSPPTSFTPQQIDDSDGMDTFGDVTDSHGSGSHYVDITHMHMPAGTIHAPIWARANKDNWHKGMKIKSNIPAFNGIVGVALNDSGGDDDFDDLVVFPTDQRPFNAPTGKGLKLNDGSILVDNAPAVPNDQGAGGGAGRSVNGLNYTLVNSNPTNTKGEYL